VGGEGVHPRAAGVGKAEQLGHLVIGFAGCVVEGFADVAVVPGLLRRAGGEVEVGVAAGDDEGEQGVRAQGPGSRRRGRVHEDSVDVAFQVVDRDEGPVGGEGEGLGEGDAYEECAGEAGTGGDGYGFEV